MTTSLSTATTSRLLKSPASPATLGAFKCIYIDPPYNTGNEGWSYSDRVNSPVNAKRWLNERTPSRRLGEDLERHDKWLSMMWPRLQLLRELLARDDGVPNSRFN